MWKFIDKTAKLMGVWEWSLSTGGQTQIHKFQPVGVIHIDPPLYKSYQIFISAYTLFHQEF